MIYGQPPAAQYALMSYVELLFAEHYRPGVPLGRLVAGGAQFGTSLMIDSLLGVAQTDFDSVAAHADGSDIVQGLGPRVGLARTKLNRAQYGAVATAVSGVPTSVLCNTALEPRGAGGDAQGTVNLYDYQNVGCGIMNVGDLEGGTGARYRSAGDPRLAMSSMVGEDVRRDVRRSR